MTEEDPACCGASREPGQSRGEAATAKGEADATADGEVDAAAGRPAPATTATWEWCADWFSPDYHTTDDYDRDSPTGPPDGESRVMRGGSYLCHESWCNRYRVAARSKNTPDSATGNTGVRCVLDAVD